MSDNTISLVNHKPPTLTKPVSLLMVSTVIGCTSIIFITLSLYESWGSIGSMGFIISLTGSGITLSGSITTILGSLIWIICSLQSKASCSNMDPKLIEVLREGFPIPRAKSELLTLIDTIENYTPDKKRKLFDDYHAFFVKADKHKETDLIPVVNKVLKDSLSDILQLANFSERTQHVLGDTLSKEKLIEVQEAAENHPLFFLYMSLYYDFIEEENDKRPFLSNPLKNKESIEKLEEFGLFNSELNKYLHFIPFIQIIYFSVLQNNFGYNNQGIDQSFAYLIDDLKVGSRETPEYYYQPESSSKLYWEYSHQILPIDRIEQDIVMLHRVAELDIVHPQTLESNRISIPFPFQGEMTKQQARLLIQLLRIQAKYPKRFETTYKELQIAFNILPPSIQKMIPENSGEDIEIATKDFCEKACTEYLMQAEKVFAAMCADFCSTLNYPKRWQVIAEPAMQAFFNSPTDAHAIQAAILCHTFREEDRFFLLPPEKINDFSQKALVSVSLDVVASIASKLRESGKTTQTLSFPTKIDHEGRAVLEELPAQFTLLFDLYGNFPSLLKFTLTIDTVIEGKALYFHRYKYYTGVERGVVLEEITASSQLNHDLVRWKGEALREIFSSHSLTE